MGRANLPYLNRTLDGDGMEGVVAYSNRLTDYWYVPVWLIVFYACVLFVALRGPWKPGGVIAYTSTAFFLVAMIAQTITPFNQIVIFFFALMALVGIVISFIEAKN